MIFCFCIGFSLSICIVFSAAYNVYVWTLFGFSVVLVNESLSANPISVAILYMVIKIMLFRKLTKIPIKIKLSLCYAMKITAKRFDLFGLVLKE